MTYGAKEVLLWQLFWLACGAFSTFIFAKAMKELDKADPNGKKWLADLGPQDRWTKHKFDAELKCDVNKTNFVESFNATLGTDRCKPVLTLLEGIRRVTMVRLATRRQKSADWEKLCPNIVKRVQSLCNESRSCRAFMSNVGEYEVMEGKSVLAVSLNKHTCLCNVWQLTSIPCKHAMRAILHEGS
jgi:SWIM zinc finger